MWNFDCSEKPHWDARNTGKHMPKHNINFCYVQYNF